MCVRDLNANTNASKTYNMKFLMLLFYVHPSLPITAFINIRNLLYLSLGSMFSFFDATGAKTFNLCSRCSTSDGVGEIFALLIGISANRDGDSVE